MWALPAIVVVELVGSTFGAPFVFSLLFFAGVVALLAQPRWCRGGRGTSWRVGGFVSVLLGVLCAWLGLPNTGAPPLLALGPDVRLALGLFGCWVIAVGSAWSAARALSFKDLERLGFLLGASFAWLFASGYRVQRLAVFPVEIWAKALALVFVGVLLGLAITAGRWHAPRLALLLGVGVCVRVLGLEVWEPDPSVRDMLPLIQSAADSLVREESPYALHAMQRGSVVPLTYLPGLWLMHNLPRAVGLPLRTTSVLADIAVVLSLWWVASGEHGIRRSRARCLALGLAAAWLLSPSVQWNAIYGEAHPYWGCLALWFALTLRGRPMASAAVLGLALATRQFAWVIAPFWLLWMLRERGSLVALKQLLVAGAVALVLVVPFVMVDPEAFWFGTLRWFPDYGSAHKSWFLARLGFAGTLYAHELEAWLMPLQVVAVAMGLVLGFRARTTPALVSVMAASYTLVVMLCPIIWSSFYLGCFVVISMALMLRDQAVVRGTWLVFPRKYWLPLGLEALALGWLAFSFWKAGSERGLPEATASLTRQAQPGDILVDRGRARVAFIQPALLTAPASVRVVGSEFDASLSGLGILSAPRVGLVFRDSRDASLALRLSRLGRVVQQGRAAEYGWLLVREDPSVGRLTAELLGGVFHAAEGGASPLEPAPDGGFRTRVASSVDVRETDCQLGGIRRRMLLAHPSDRGELALEFVRPEAAKRLVLIAGFDDRVVRWGRADVRLGLRIKANDIGELSVRNLPGIQWDVFDVANAGGMRIELRLTTPEDRQRWLCVDGVWLGTAPQSTRSSSERSSVSSG